MDRLVDETGIPAPTLASTLLTLELLALVEATVHGLALTARGRAALAAQS